MLLSTRRDCYTRRLSSNPCRPATQTRMNPKGPPVCQTAVGSERGSFWGFGFALGEVAPIHLGFTCYTLGPTFRTTSSSGCLTPSFATWPKSRVEPGRDWELQAFPRTAPKNNKLQCHDRHQNSTQIVSRNGWVAPGSLEDPWKRLSVVTEVFAFAIAFVFCMLSICMKPTTEPAQIKAHSTPWGLANSGRPLTPRQEP